ncbi:UDP-2,4-diacetamido-2,4,6-trideoxy-beta-L-altropyranose hydrolase [Flavivirga spongiicola]|uniref:UDP-2,4-diacetamido-2,4, 6-trideoxy-beta-L-altropyranose hydrolase n=1 Tax=Flavivirga spongiicola TaxID=421621 RepID=A0ABU7XSU1_9FLAO|nr:UDP-2,4-diacetamido-2,4,6-trideoxy-beta-L-altropyranose hydrolase [Flavivirga sp. MEBiC05379]MDO5978850.1 UDP-2,4-diacetamido-2,4,6-trideoxy-beta-L-altropyranose hydrolase [Flavivirga sp. MEBiC05379]
MKYKKKIIFRADGNSKTGLGHLYRIFALIEMLKENYEYVLITRADSELIIIPKSYSVEVIPSKISITEEPDWLLEKYETTNSIVIADGYAYDSNYQKSIKKVGYKLIYIDDLTATEMFADVVINHSLVVKPEHFKAKPETEFALGSHYAMLRPKFIEIAKKSKQPSNVKEVFVSFGGADFYDLTSKAVRALTNLNYVKKIHVLIGAANKHKNIYKIEEENSNVVIHKNLPEAEVLDVMEKCQLAIVPSSTISYEVCSVKMLVICGYFIDNQELIYNGLREKKVIFPAGDFTHYDVIRFERVINEAIELDMTEQNEMLRNQKTLFDGNQKERFLDIINRIN